MKKAIQIKENVYWVGGIDWDLRDFHGYSTKRGSTYNAYLIIDEKVTLIDSVKHYLSEEMIERISSVVDPGKIDIIVSNHVEMDHSGSIPHIKRLAPNAKIYCSPNGLKGLQRHYKQDWGMNVVKSGDSINIGKRNLSFVLTPMVHWPDNMISYCPEEKILFSNDAFGQHIASSERFDDQLAEDIVFYEARKYYANIVLPFGAQVQKALSTAAGLEIEIIAPSHGVVWRKNIAKVIEEYQKWSTDKTENQAIVIYDTMWESTQKMAHAIMDGFENKGIHTKLCSLKHNHISDIITDVLTAKYICVGSPTLNNNMLPTVAAFLTYLKGLAPKKRKALAFGSYGWGGQSVGQVEEQLKACKFELLFDGIKIDYVPDPEQLIEITEKIEKSVS